MSVWMGGLGAGLGVICWISSGPGGKRDVYDGVQTSAFE